MNKEIELGDVFLIHTLEELKEKYVNFQEDNIYVRIKHPDISFWTVIKKEYLGKQLIVFSMDYRDYPEPCLCLTTNTKYKEYFGQRMSGKLEWQDWITIEDDRELLPFIKESKNIFDICN